MGALTRILPQSSVLSPPSPLAVREWGHGAPLVALHGLASSSRYWEANQAHLTKSYRVIAPDLLGFGRSPRPADGAYSPEEHVAALAAALRPRLDRPVTLVGHSMGAMLALHFTHAYPELVGRLLLVSLPAVGSHAWGHSPEGTAPWHHWTVHTRPGQAIFNTGMAVARPAWYVVAPLVRRTVPPAAARDALRASWTSYWHSLEHVVFGSDAPALFAGVKTPLAVIHGRRDFLVPVASVRELVRTRPDVRYVEIPDAGHNPCYTHSAVFYEALAGL